jgi:type II secretory pathway pseudopilin PulG
MDVNSSESSNKSGSAQDFFLYLLVFLSLTFVAFGEGNILFQFINKFIPGPDNAYSNIFNQGSVKFGIAALFIAAPLFFIISKIINRRIVSGTIFMDSGVRRWLTYIVLFFAAATALGDLIAVIVNFLNGDYTTSFLLQMLVILGISGSIFGYYFWEMRRKVLDSPIIKKAAATCMCVIVVTFVAAFFVIDSPTMSREKRIDQQAVDSLQTVDNSVRNYFDQSGKLPMTLDDLKQTGFEPVLQNDNSVKYEKKSDNTYQLCANFVRSNLNDQQNQSGEIISKEWNHAAGNVCFDRVALSKNPASVPIK